MSMKDREKRSTKLRALQRQQIRAMRHDMNLIEKKFQNDDDSFVIISNAIGDNLKMSHIVMDKYW